MNRFFLSILFCMLIFMAGCTDVNIDDADDGTLDLSHREFDNNNVYKMRGEWKIAWNQFLDPIQDRQKIESLDTYVTVPQNWSSLNVNGTTIGNQGFGTLVLDIDTGENSHPLAIESTYITSAFDIYANGALIVSNGTPGKSASSMKAVWHPDIGTVAESNGKIQLVIHFSNFNHRRFVIKDLYIGSESAVTRHKRDRLAMDLITFGSISIMGLYHLMIYILRRRDRASLFFSILCLSYSARTLMVGDRFIYEVFPNIPWELFMKLAYTTFYITVASIVLFVQSTFSTFRHKSVKNIMAASALVITSTTLLLPARIFDMLLLPFEFVVFCCFSYLLIVIVNAAILNETGARAMLISFFLLVLAAVNDMLYEDGIIGTTSLTPFALTLLIYAQSYILAKRFTQAYKYSEELLEENMRINISLNEHNENLEEIIEQRTFEIKEMNEELQTSNEELIELITAVNKSEAHFRSLFENMPIGVFRYGSKSGFQMVNPRMAEIFGFEFPHELSIALNSKSYSMIDDNHKWNEFLDSLSQPQDEQTSLQVQMVMKNGEPITTEVTYHIAENSGTEIFCEGTITDISKRISMEDELNLMASTDALTGLYNRRMFSERMKQVNGDTCLAIIDIDDFKNINDTYGHDVGDLVLKKTAKTLLDVCGSSAFVSRIGGEEFGIVFDAALDKNTCSLVEDIRNAISSSPFIHCSEKIFYSVSIGVCTTTDCISPPEVFKHADVALYNAKESGKNQVCYFNSN